MHSACGVRGCSARGGENMGIVWAKNMAFHMVGVGSIDKHFAPRGFKSATSLSGKVVLRAPDGAKIPTLDCCRYWEPIFNSLTTAKLSGKIR